MRQWGDERLALLGPVVRHLPVLNDLGQPVDMLSWSEIWKLPISMPSLGGNEVKYVVDYIETSWVSSQGKYVTEFQDAFSAYHQALALHLFGNDSSPSGVALGWRWPRG